MSDFDAYMRFTETDEERKLREQSGNGTKGGKRRRSRKNKRSNKRKAHKKRATRRRRH